MRHEEPNFRQEHLILVFVYQISITTSRFLGKVFESGLMHDMSMELSYLPWGTGKRACFCGLPCLLSKGTLSPTSGPQEKQPSALTFAQSIIPLPFPSPAGRREDFIHSLSLAYPLEMIFPLQCWFFYYFHTISWAQESWWRGSQVTV